VHLKEKACLQEELAAILQGYMQNGKKDAFGYERGDETSNPALAVTASPACSS